MATRQQFSISPIPHSKTQRKDSRHGDAVDLLWSRLDGSRLSGHHFQRHVVILGFPIEIYCPAASLIVEVDDAPADSRSAYAVARDLVLWRRGFRVVRIKRTEVLNDIGGVLDRIRLRCWPMGARLESRFPREAK